MRIFILTAISVVVFLHAEVLASQTENRINVTGTVKDASGAVVSGAYIELNLNKCKCSDCKPSNGCNCCAIQIYRYSDSSGNYTFSVCHGTYKLSANAQGRTVVLNLDLNEGTDRTADITIPNVTIQ